MSNKDSSTVMSGLRITSQEREELRNLVEARQDTSKKLLSLQMFSLHIVTAIIGLVLFTDL